jgi:hypothetical protein
MKQIQITYTQESKLMAYNSAIFKLIVDALMSETSETASSVVDTMTLASVDSAPVFLSQAQIDVINWSLASRGIALQLE